MFSQQLSFILFQKWQNHTSVVLEKLKQHQELIDGALQMHVDGSEVRLGSFISLHFHPSDFHCQMMQTKANLSPAACTCGRT